jgi:hypothetical protein
VRAVFVQPPDGTDRIEASARRGDAADDVLVFRSRAIVRYVVARNAESTDQVDFELIAVP